MTDSVLVLAAPGLLSLPAEFLGGQRAFGHLARHAAPARSEPAGIERALCDTLSLPGDGGLAAFAAYGAGLAMRELEGATLAYSDPIHLEAGRTDVIVSGRVTDLTLDESAALVEALSTHLAIDGLGIVEARPDAWFARAASGSVEVAIGTGGSAYAESSSALAATARVPPPERVAGQSISPRVPRAPVAGTRLRWQGEIETLLHAEATNAARAARGAATVDALWFWGGGALPVVAGVRRAVSAHAPPGRIGDLVTGIALASRGSVLPWRGSQAGIARFLDAFAAGSGPAQATTPSPASSSEPSPAPSPGGKSPAAAVVAVEPIHSEEDAVAFARDWLAPSLARLEAHSIGELVLVADGRDSAGVWRARIPGLAARLRARLERPRFAAPVSTDE